MLQIDTQISQTLNAALGANVGSMIAVLFCNCASLFVDVAGVEITTGSGGKVRTRANGLTLVVAGEEGRLITIRDVNQSSRPDDKNLYIISREEWGCTLDLGY